MRNSLLVQSLGWLLRWSQLSVLMLVSVIIISAIGVAQAAYQTRLQYTHLQSIGYETDRLDSDYEKLLLEQSAWADFSRVDRVSRNELGMLAPGPQNMVIVKR